MAFMKPQYHDATDYVVYIDTHEPGGGSNVIAAYDYEPSMGAIEEEGTGCLYRLSAPGYMDCTDWNVADTIEEAKALLMRDHGVCPACGANADWPVDVDECPECEEAYP